MVAIIMRQKEFNMLNDDAKSNALWINASLVDIIRKEDLTILLYQLSDFYVEVYYNYLKNQIEKFISFNSTDQLEPYLDKISLAGLV
ncbi:MAG TPA: hypothetical protein VGO09_10455 [Flavisolibacter sp.]|nr:hypothetical protein [Flavisolibacter sp.]